MSEDDRQKARQLQAWLITLDLPPRVINPLRRDLEVVLGEREGTPGKSGGLAGIDRERFVVELYRDEGGVIRKLPAVGALVIEALREVIPPLRATATTKRAAPPMPDEGWREFEIDEAPAPPAAPPTPVENQFIDEPDFLTIAAPAETPVAPDDEPPATPRRRGRPRKHTGAALGSTQQRRTPANITAPAAPPPNPAVQALAPLEAVIATEPDESELRQLWRELHPQGRRAVLGYISELLIQ
jgi:hypothetical protein